MTEHEMYCKHCEDMTLFEVEQRQTHTFVEIGECTGCGHIYMKEV